MQGEAAAPVPGDTLKRAAIKVLRAGDPHVKAQFGAIAARLWESGEIAQVCRAEDASSAQADVYDRVPDEPARDEKVKSVAPKDMPKRGKGGSLQSRQALIHSLVHIENCAIDLSWDIVARFCDSTPMPRAFYDDFVRIADEEGKHFSLLAQRLRELGSFYGAFPVHQGLWETAAATAGSLSARLALEHCVHEARGLDVVPQTISRFRAAGDNESADLLETVIYPEEITHCAAGVRWFTYLCCREMGLVKGPKGALNKDPTTRTLSEGSEGAPLGPSLMSINEGPKGALNEGPETTLSEGPEGSVEEGPKAIVNEGPKGAPNEEPETTLSDGPEGTASEGCRTIINEGPKGALNGGPEMALDEGPEGVPGKGPKGASGNGDGGMAEQEQSNGHSCAGAAARLQNGSKTEAGLRGLDYEEGTCAGFEENEGEAGAGQEGVLGMGIVMGARGDPYVVQKFHETVRAHFRGILKPPFNKGAREKAGFVEEWYVPLAQR